MFPTSLSLLERLHEPTDTIAWQRFTDLYSDLIRYWLNRAGLQSCDADDLTQEVLITLVRELPNFRHGGRSGSFRGWLRMIAVNRLREFWRGKRRRPDAMGDSNIGQMLDQLEDPNSGLSQLWDREHDAQVARRLMELIAPEFAPSTMNAFQRLLAGEEPAAVAQALGLTTNAVLIAKSRVLARLRQETKGLLE